MTKAKLHAPDFTEANVARLAELFPSCLVEAKDEKTGEITRKIDFDQPQQERHRLNWWGK